MTTSFEFSPLFSKLINWSNEAEAGLNNILLYLYLYIFISFKI